MEFNEIKAISAQYDHKRPILTELRAVTIYDESPDLSYLETDEPEDAERLESYGDTWYCVGVRVIAKFVVPHAGHQFYIHEHAIKSGGLWGIESDSGHDYFGLVANDEWHELEQELRMMNVVIPDSVEMEYRFNA